MTPSINKILALAVLAFCSITTAAPLYESTHSLVKRATWTPGQTHCPSGDGAIYAAADGGKYRIDCDTDTISSGYISSISPSGNLSLQDCMDLCDKHANQCHRVSFIGNVDTGGACYLKAGQSSSDLKSVDSSHKVATRIN